VSELYFRIPCAINGVVFSFLKKERTMNDPLHVWKVRLFDATLVVLFVVGLAKLLYYEIWK
jgi:hypothetical protein